MLHELRTELNKLKDKAKELGEIAKIQDKKQALGKVEQESADPKLWQDQNRAKKVMQEKKVLEKEIGNYEEMVNGI